MIVLPFHQTDRVELPLASDFTFDFPPGDIWDKLAALDDAAADLVAAEIRATGRATVVSGDCLVAMATLAGVQRAGLQPAVVWFDAHGDLHTLSSSTSGYLGGLSLRLLLGAHAALLGDRLGVTPVPEDRCVLVDARDLDPAESDFLDKSHIRRTGVTALDSADLPDGPLLVHVDVDVIDPSDLPGLLFPVPGGPRATEVAAAVRRLLDTGRVAALDISLPWHPTDDPAVEQIRSALVHDLLAA